LVKPIGRGANVATTMYAAMITEHARTTRYIRFSSDTFATASYPDTSTPRELARLSGEAPGDIGTRGRGARGANPATPLNLALMERRFDSRRCMRF